VTERRTMEQTRKRVDEIAASMESYRERLDARYRRVGLLLIAMVAVGILAVLAGYLILQGQRWDAVRDGCERTNQQAEATVGLLRDLKVREQVVLLAGARYPHTPPLAHRSGTLILPGPLPGYEGPMTCEQFATEAVGRFRA
jgi:hypothetical protein